MAVAVPETPLTASGGVAWPEESLPQQTTLPVTAWIAQLWSWPAETSVAVAETPLTASGGVGPAPQQTTLPVPAWIAQLREPFCG